jgi:hypothetical protein
MTFLGEGEMGLDGLKNNPNKFKMNSVTLMTTPYDFAGLCQLTWRYLESVDDMGFVYLPIIRRVKRVSSAQRSDPNMGSDSSMDDQNCFYGTVESMEWDFVGEQDFLLPIMRDVAEDMQYYKEFPDGSWRAQKDPLALKFGYQEPNWKGAPWAPLNIVWIPRDCWILELNPKDPYYNYGKQLLYIDKRNLSPMFKIIYDRSDQYWKTIMTLYTLYKNKFGKISSTGSMYIAIDDKKHHASVSISGGMFKGKKFRTISHAAGIDPSIFTINSLTNLSR